MAPFLPAFPARSGSRTCTDRSTWRPWFGCWTLNPMPMGSSALRACWRTKRASIRNEQTPRLDEDGTKSSRMTAWISWYLIVTLLGWLTFPLIYRLFPALADRGYSLARAAGLLIWAYIFWLFTSLGLTREQYRRHPLRSAAACGPHRRLLLCAARNAGRSRAIRGRRSTALIVPPS